MDAVGPGIADLVKASRFAVGGAEDASGAVEVLAVFDHDHQAHVLVQEWVYGDDEPRWSYRLWFRDGADVVPVRFFADAEWPEPPLVEAAAIVAEWRRLVAGEHLSGGT
ncbi:MAG: hypothetical protein KJS90_08075 [Acidobacteria bacterium]|nr:hypothetical protein [Acidobacteriota bacterium]